MFCKTAVVCRTKLNIHYFSFFCRTNMCKADKIVIQNLIKTPFSRETVAEKNKMIKDR
jgi:hypothetical protein